MVSEPSIDYERRALSIPRRLMPSLLAVQTGSSARPDSAAELAAGGFLAAGRLDPLARTLLGAMTEPTLIVSLDITRAPLPPRLVTIWQRGPIAVAGTTERRRFHIVQVEPALLPFHVIQALRLTPVPQPRYKGGFSMPPAAVEAVASGTPPSDLETLLLGAGVDPVWIDRFLAALVLRRALWTMEVVSLTTDEGHMTMSVLDGGHAGYWGIRRSGATRVTVTPVDFDQLVTRIASLLP